MIFRKPGDLQAGPVSYSGASWGRLGVYIYTRDLYFLFSLKAAQLSEFRKPGPRTGLRGTQATHSVSLGPSLLFCKRQFPTSPVRTCLYGCRSPVLIPGLSQAALPEVAGLPRAVHAGPAGPLGLWTHGAPSREDTRQHRFGGECVLTFYSPLQGRAKIRMPP